MNSPLDESRFHPALRSALDEAQHHFDEAARYAHDNGLLAEVTRQPEQLTLQVKRPSDGAPCRYRIAALASVPEVMHEKCYGADIDCLEATLDSVNQTVVETELASFFIRSAALPLDYIAQRHHPDYT